MLGGVQDVAPLTQGRINVQPNVVAHFDTRAIYMFGIDPSSPSANLRFTVGAITVGGNPQWANNDFIPDGIGNELLSDVFNRSDQPLLVYNWAIISTDALGSPLVFDVFNLNPTTIRIYITLFGNAMNDCFITKWKEAELADKTIFVDRIKRPGKADAFEFKEVEETKPVRSKTRAGTARKAKLRSRRKRKKRAHRGRRSR